MKYKKDFATAIKMNNSKFQKILEFYLFECPTPNRSVRSKTFADYGWIGRSKFSSLKKSMLSAASDSLKNNYYPCKKEELKEKFQLVKKVSPTDEYCVFLKYDEKSVMQSLYSAIRNAFAHGSFSVRQYSGVKIYFFANEKKYLKAEIILQENTLLKWIDIIKNNNT